MPIYPLVEDKIAGTRPGIRRRTIPNKFVPIKLTTEIIDRVPEHTLEVVAEEVFNNPQLWYLIADINKIRHPSEWREGDVLLIPTKVR